MAQAANASRQSRRACHLRALTAARNLAPPAAANTPRLSVTGARREDRWARPMWGTRGRRGGGNREQGGSSGPPIRGQSPSNIYFLQYAFDVASLLVTELPFSRADVVVYLIR